MTENFSPSVFLNNQLTDIKFKNFQLYVFVTFTIMNKRPYQILIFFKPPPFLAAQNRMNETAEDFIFHPIIANYNPPEIADNGLHTFRPKPPRVH